MLSSQDPDALSNLDVYLNEKNTHKLELVKLVNQIYGCNNHTVVGINNPCTPVVHHTSHKTTDHSSQPLVTANRYDVIAEVSDMDNCSTSPDLAISPQTRQCSEDVPLVMASLHSTPIEIFIDTASKSI